MKKIAAFVITGLLAFNTNAETTSTDPELWICTSINLEDTKRIYFVYRGLDFMMFAEEGGLLDLGTLTMIQNQETTFLTTILKLKSGPRNMFISNMAEKNTLLMQIFLSNNDKRADLFTCR